MHSRTAGGRLRWRSPGPSAPLQPVGELDAVGAGQWRQAGPADRVAVGHHGPVAELAGRLAQPVQQFAAARLRGRLDAGAVAHDLGVGLRASSMGTSSTHMRRRATGGRSAGTVRMGMNRAGAGDLGICCGEDSRPCRCRLSPASVLGNIISCHMICCLFIFEERYMDSPDGMLEQAPRFAERVGAPEAAIGGRRAPVLPAAGHGRSDRPRLRGAVGAARPVRRQVRVAVPVARPVRRLSPHDWPSAVSRAPPLPACSMGWSATVSCGARPMRLTGGGCGCC